MIEYKQRKAVSSVVWVRIAMLKKEGRCSERRRKRTGRVDDKPKAG